MFGYFLFYTPIYRLMKKNKLFHVQHFPCETVGAKIGNVLGLLVHDTYLSNLAGMYSSLIYYNEKHSIWQN